MRKGGWWLVLAAAVVGAYAAGPSRFAYHRYTLEVPAQAVADVVGYAVGTFSGYFVTSLLLLMALCALGNLWRKHWARYRGYCAAVTRRRSWMVAALVLGMIGVAMLLVAFLLLAIVVVLIL